MTRRNLLIALTSAAALTGVGFAQKPVTQQPDKLAQADENVKELLLLMDTDKNGKISRQEWMNFMAAEFDKLDKDGKGELDLKTLEQSRLFAKRASSASAPR